MDKYLKLLCCLLCLGLLSGCQTMGTAYMPVSEMEKFQSLNPEKRAMNDVRVRWEIVEDVVKHCARTVGMGLEQSYMTPPQGCATWSKARQACTIYTPRVTTHTVLGHELRHCFEGHFHR